MRTLHQLLREGSMLYHSLTQAQIDSDMWQWGPASATDRIARPPRVVADAVGDVDRARRLPIWSWQSRASDLRRIENIRCRVRSMDFENMSVAEEIRWENPVFSHEGTDHDLPLTRDYLILRGHSSTSEERGSDNGFWQLPASLDDSILDVFGYRLTDGGIEPMPVPPGFRADFWPETTPSTVDVVAGARGHSTATMPVYLLVVKEFVTCKERDDFEPLGIAGMGRLYPLMSVLANQPIDRVQTTLRVQRSRHSSMPHDSGHEYMDHEIRAGFWTDTNMERSATQIGPIPPTAFWDNIFDYYNVAPDTQLRTWVDPDQRQREIANAIEAWEVVISGEPSFLSPWLNADLAYVRRNITKVARQGAYDNIHLAPRMRRNEDAAFDIAMAPVCAHDCLHMHVRWGSMWEGVEYLKGWDENFVPFRVVGAPMVPTNQEVKVAKEETHDRIGYRYEVVARGYGSNTVIEAQKWSVFHHHGLAYALTVDATWVSPGVNADRVLHPMLWAEFYHNIQYHSRNPSLPRLRLTPGSRAVDG